MNERAIRWKEEGNEHYKERRFKEAIHCYAEALRLDSQYTDAWHNLGMTLKRLGHDEEAAQCFQKAHMSAYPAEDVTPSPRTIQAPAAERRPASQPGVDKNHDRPYNGKSGYRARSPGRASGKAWVYVFILLVTSLIVISTLSFLNGGVNTGGPLPGREIITGTTSPASDTVFSPFPDGPVTTAPTGIAVIKTGAVASSFPYVVRGSRDTVGTTLYRGVYDQVSEENPYCYVGKQDRYQKFIDLGIQRPYLIPLVESIRNKTSDPDDQARIAISLVQQIPYDEEMLESGKLEIRYPYQTLYDNKGVCCEKSVLLALVLKELGFGVALFDFSEEQHTAVGIRVSPEYSYKNSGYAFIETTTPAIMSNGEGNYPAFGKIVSTPEVLPVCDGRAFGSIGEEWKDSREWNRLDSLGPVLGKSDFYSWQNLCRKYGIVPG